MRRTLSLLALVTALPLAAPAEEIGKVGVDWIGNDIVIEALADPKVQGVTCHLAYFERSTIDRLVQGTGSRTRRIPPSPAARRGPSPWATSTRGPRARRSSANASRCC